MITEALVEVTALAEKGGVPNRSFIDFINGSVLGSTFIRHKAKPSSTGTTPQRSTTRCCAEVVDDPLLPRSAMFAHLAKGAAVHSRDHIASSGDYVREGRRNAFDPGESHPMPVT
jgi:hypothetical protein